MSKRRQRKKQPKSRIHPRVAKKPKSCPFPNRQIRWSFGIFDDHQWGKDDEAYDEPFRKVAKHLKDLQRLTWTQLEQKKNGSHPIQVAELRKPVRDRLVLLNQDDADSLWSLRIGSRCRLWGIRVDDALQVLWWDPEHKVWPTKKKNT